MSEYSAVRGGKLKLKGGLVSGQKKKKRKREHSKHDEDGEYKHGREYYSSLIPAPFNVTCMSRVLPRII